MKKIILLVLVFTFLITSVACESEATNQTEDTNETIETASDTNETSDENVENEQEETETTEEGIDYPSKPVQLIVPVKAGGDTDYNARVLAVALEKALGNPVVVTNIDGGATVVGMNHVMDSEPDGHTILINGTDQFVPEMLGNTDLTLTSFKTAGISLIDNTTVLAVHKDSGFTTLPELVEQSKENPGEIEYGMKLGATNQICGVAMDEEWGTAFNHVDVGNNAAKIVALLGRQTDVINVNYGLATDYFESGEFVPVVLLGSEKNSALPDLPLASDYDLENLDFSKFFWLGMHPDTPDEIVKMFNDALKEATEDTELNEKMEERFLTVKYMEPEEAEEFALNLYEETMLPYKDEFLRQQ